MITEEQKKKMELENNKIAEKRMNLLSYNISCLKQNF
jgi:hypothetical protein